MKSKYQLTGDFFFFFFYFTILITGKTSVCNYHFTSVSVAHFSREPCCVEHDVPVHWHATTQAWALHYLPNRVHSLYTCQGSRKN